MGETTTAPLKVAWLFAGLPRSPEFGSSEFLRLMKCYNSTVVAHFWSCDESGRLESNKRSTVRRPNGKLLPELLPDTYPDAIEDFKKIYSPSKIITEPCSVDIAVSPDERRKYVRAFFGQISAQRALSLVQPFEFDIIVRCRTDVLLYQKEVKRLDMPEGTALYTVGNFFNPSLRVNDTFLYGKPKVMVPIINSVDLFWQLPDELARDVHETLAYHSKRLGISVFNVGGPKSGRKVKS